MLPSHPFRRRWLLSLLAIFLLSALLLWLFWDCAAWDIVAIHASQNPASANDAVSICVAVKDDMDLGEFVNYHLSIGIERIFVYDNGSSPPLSSQLAAFIADGVVEYVYAPFSFYKFIAPLIFFRSGVRNTSLRFYGRCLQKARRDKFAWMAFIDADEYIVLTSQQNETISQVLRRFRDYGGVELYWKLFASSGHVKRPESGVLKSYTKCGATSITKSVVNVKYTIKESDNVHYFVYHKDHPAVNEKEQLRTADTNFKSFDELYINHYCTRSYEDMLAKVKRGTGTSKRRFDYFYWAENIATDSCPVLKPRTTKYVGYS